MRQLVVGLMLANAALFLFGAMQHAGMSIGLLREHEFFGTSTGVPA
jgi:hypothetical protein